MKNDMKKMLADTLWVAHTLFDCQLVTGSTGNISFMYDHKIYISRSGSCFGRLTQDDFAVLDQNGKLLSNQKPSKEYPLHVMLYQKKGYQAVIHTHSFYATLWSCQHDLPVTDIMPDYTPYLRMKVGSIGLIPYEKPGSQALFEAFAQRLDASDGYLLAHHGPVLGGKDMMDAFSKLTELEESAHIAWALRAREIS